MSEINIKEKPQVKRDYHDPNGYLVRCGYQYTVYQSLSKSGTPMHRFKVGSKKYGYTYKYVSFWKGKGEFVAYPTGTVVIPLRMVETFFYYKGNEKAPVFALNILEWEVVKNKYEKERDRKMETQNNYQKELELKNMQ